MLPFSMSPSQCYRFQSLMFLYSMLTSFPIFICGWMILHVWIFESMSKIGFFKSIFINENITQNLRINLGSFVQKSVPFSSWMGVLYFRSTINDVTLLVMMEFTYRIIALIYSWPFKKLPLYHYYMFFL